MNFQEMHERVSKSSSGRFWLDLYPMTKIVILLCCSMMSIFLPGYIFGFALMFIFYFLTLSCGRAGAYFKVMLSVLVLFVLLLIAARAFFYGSGPVIASFGRFSVYLNGVKEGLGKSSVILGFSSSIVFFFSTTDMENLMLSLEQHNCPSNATFVILSAFQMIPQMGSNAKVIQDAQRARGIETEGGLKTRARAFLPMLLPLLLSSFSVAEEKSLALETRGFNYPCQKTRLRVVLDRKGERIFRVIFIAVTVVVCVVGGYYKWLA